MPDKSSGFLWWLALLLLAVGMAGCTDSSERITGRNDSVSPSAAHRNESAEQFLTEIFRRYRSAAAYHDAAIVRLSFESEGRFESRVAPLNVWFDHDALKIEAYDIRLWSDEKAVTAWIDDPSINHFDSQVLRMPPIVGRPKLGTLLSDPVLAERLGAGLAGPPPQLEWLYAAEPMKYLFDDKHRFEFGRQQTVGGHECVSIAIDAAGDEYLFWIDAREGLIRRVDFPPISTMPLATASTSDVKLSLELVAASFDAPLAAPPLASLPKRPRFVRRFVPLPPDPPPQQLGTRPTPFHQMDTRSTFEISDKGSDRPVTVLTRYSGDAASIAATETLGRWAAMMAKPLRDRVRIVIVADDLGNERTSQHLTLPTVLDQGSSIANRYRLTSSSLVVLGPDGKIAWMQDELHPQDLAALGAIVGDVLRGVDVPARVRAQWNESVKVYQAHLADQQLSLK